MKGLKDLAIKLLPWVITVVALYLAFGGVDWQIIVRHLHEVDPSWLCVAFSCTCLSYLFRSRRWQDLFPEHTLSFSAATRTLILGFFMNNILPARAGELVRAHMGSRLSGQTRTLVLATIASERLIDGLTISLMFVAFAIGLGDQNTSQNMLYVAYGFAIVAATVILTLIFRAPLFALAEKVSELIEHRASNYTLDRFQVFVNGLSPLTTISKLPVIIGWSAVVWGTELLVYISVLKAYSTEVPLAYAVLFLVAVNFSSLIPSAPGAIGVIEAIASAVLVSIGIEKEHALTMVMTQHVIQYLVVGLPGAIILLTWRKNINSANDERTGNIAARGSALD
ncbi:MAG: hypothetical protein DCC75_10020 [Proteobacteria bacterium]|nr:MAG: hypothetical protein DCC75_10020 [Pseudomonadota bacterium]